MTGKNPALHFIFINGKPAAGKDTQADMLVEEIPHSVNISTGFVLRSALSKMPGYERFYEIVKPYSHEINNRINIPDNVIMEIVPPLIEDNVAEGTTTFLFAGFPRTIPQLNAIDSYLNDLRRVYKVKDDFVHLLVSDEVAWERTEKRRRAMEAAGIARADDTKELLIKGIEKFETQTMPMLNKLDLAGRLATVNAEGPKEIAHEITKQMLGITVNKETRREISPLPRRARL